MTEVLEDASDVAAFDVSMAEGGENPCPPGTKALQGRFTAGKIQAGLARELGISQRAITEIETGQATIQVRPLLALLKEFGENIRRLRKVNGMSASELASRALITRETLRNIEAATGSPLAD
jgi:transcriptional regulator with XRE-family HTH domain